MYDAFDKFLARDTWHTNHPLDEQAFYRCLNDVVRSDNFNADEMGEYFYQKKGISREDGAPLGDAVDRWVSNAWAVREYLKATDSI